MPDDSPPHLNPDANRATVELALARLRERQNLPAALIAGVVAALAGAGVWALVTALTEFQIGWMAVGVGFLVGFAVRTFGRGIERHFGYVGAALALLGCGLGNLLAVIALVAHHENIGFFALLGHVDWAAMPDVMVKTFTPMDLVFYGIALYEGYRFSLRPVTQDDLAAASSGVGTAV